MRSGFKLLGSSSSGGNRKRFVPGADKPGAGRSRVQREFAAIGGQVAGLVKGPVELAKLILPGAKEGEPGALDFAKGVGHSFLHTARDILPANEKDASILERVLPGGHALYRAQHGTYADVLAEDFGNIATIFAVGGLAQGAKAGGLARSARAAAEAGDVARATALRAEALDAAQLADKIRAMPSAPLKAMGRKVAERSIAVSRGETPGLQLEGRIGQAIEAQRAKKLAKTAQREILGAAGQARRDPYSITLSQGAKRVGELYRERGTKLPPDEAQRLFAEEVQFRAERMPELRAIYERGGMPPEILGQLPDFRPSKIAADNLHTDPRLAQLTDAAVAQAPAFKANQATAPGVEISFTRDPRAARLHNTVRADARKAADLRAKRVELQGEYDNLLSRELGSMSLERAQQLREHLRGFYLPGHDAAVASGLQGELTFPPDMAALERLPVDPGRRATVLSRPGEPTPVAPELAGQMSFFPEDRTPPGAAPRQIRGQGEMFPAPVQQAIPETLGAGGALPPSEPTVAAQLRLQAHRDRVRAWYQERGLEPPPETAVTQPEIPAAPLGQLPLHLRPTRAFEGQAPDFPEIALPPEPGRQGAFNLEPYSQPRLAQDVPRVNRKTGEPLTDELGRPLTKKVEIGPGARARSSEAVFGELKGLDRTIREADKQMARRLEAMAKLDDRIVLQRVPAQLQPFYSAALRGRRELIAWAKEGKLSAEEVSQLLDGMPFTVSSVLQKMADGELPTPVHFRDFDQATARALGGGRPELFSRPRFLKTQEAGTRKERDLAQRARPGASERLGAASAADAHIAAAVEVAKEAVSNDLVHTIKTEFAIPLGPDSPLRPGFVPFDEAAIRRAPAIATSAPEGPFSRFQPAERTPIPDPNVTHQIPQALESSLRRNFTGGWAHLAIPTTGIMSNWRALVLLHSPRWLVNNVFGNLMLSAVEGSAFDLRAWRDAWAQGRFTQDVAGQAVRTPFAGVPQEVALGSFEHELADTNSAILARTPIAKVTRNVNEWTDNFARSLVFSKRLRQGADRAFLETGELINSDAVFARISAGEKLSAGETRAVAIAAERARKSLVDYSDLTPFERSLVRRIVPFYAWQKGILKLALSLPFDHPSRFAAINAVTNFLGGYSREERQAYPEYLVNSIEVAGHRFSTRGLNPFADAFSLVRPGEGGLQDSLGPDIRAASQFVLRSGANPFGPQEVSQYGTLEPQVGAEDVAFEFLRDLPFGRAILQPKPRPGQEPAPIDIRQQLLSYVGGVTERTPTQIQAAIDREAKNRRAALMSQNPQPAQQAASSSGGLLGTRASTGGLDFFKPKRPSTGSTRRLLRRIGGQRILGG